MTENLWRDEQITRARDALANLPVRHGLPCRCGDLFYPKELEQIVRAVADVLGRQIIAERQAEAEWQDLATIIHDEDVLLLMNDGCANVGRASIKAGKLKFSFDRRDGVNLRHGEEVQKWRRIYGD